MIIETKFESEENYGNQYAHHLNSKKVLKESSRVFASTSLSPVKRKYLEYRKRYTNSALVPNYRSREKNLKCNVFRIRQK